MAVPTKVTLYQGNDQYVEIDGLFNPVSATFVNDAVVTATLVDPTGLPVSGLTNITLQYLAASSGNYRGQVTSVFQPVSESGYVLQVTATSGGFKFYIEVKASVKVRKA